MAPGPRASCASTRTRRWSPSGSSELERRLVLALEHVERPQLARGAHRPAIAVLGVTGGEVVAGHPRPEVLLRSPAGQPQTHLALIVRSQQLEALEPGRVLDLPRSPGEPLLELREALPRDGDRVDLDDAHAQILVA